MVATTPHFPWEWSMALESVVALASVLQAQASAPGSVAIQCRHQA